MRAFLIGFFGAFLSVAAQAQEIEPVSGVELKPDAGKEIGYVFEAWMSPQQEGGEERDTPGFIPSVFKSTAPSVDRNERTSRGHGTLAFTRDFSKAYAHVALENVNPEDVVMFHIHCGRPGQLGPIIIDFGLENDLTQALADGVLSVEITNEDIVAAKESGHGLIAAFTAGCPITPLIPGDKVITIEDASGCSRME